MFRVIIPARFAASRLPGKPLLLLGGRPMIQWVWQSARASGAASVLIATDDERVRTAAIGFGAECLMTATSHQSGTDRMAEVVKVRAYSADDIVVNVQGDEPLMPAALIEQVAAVLYRTPGADLATAVTPIRTLTEFLDPNCVKAVCAADGRALYFSRAPVPWPREEVLDGRPTRFDGALRHIGIYAYRVQSLLRFAAWPPTSLEQSEKLEQLRALEHGMRIQTLTVAQAPPAGVDTPADLQRVISALSVSALQQRA